MIRQVLKFAMTYDGGLANVVNVWLGEAFLGSSWPASVVTDERRLSVAEQDAAEPERTFRHGCPSQLFNFRRAPSVPR
jgi:hypothetical protein